MHYFVDGYNLLFRIARGKMTLQKKREILLSALASFNLNLTVVFDSTQEKYGVEDRGHWHDLEIVYTEEGQTADAYILHELSLSNTPRREMVITSDKLLASHCRHYGAKTQSIEEFLERQAHRKLKKRTSKSVAFKESDFEISRLLKIFEERLENPTEDEP